MPETPDVPGPGKDLDAYLRTLRRRWKAIAVAMAVILGGVSAWTYRQPKIYRTSTSVVIDPMAPQVLSGVKDVVELGTGSYWANREFYETQYRIIKSVEVAERVIEILGLENDLDYPFAGAGKDPKKNRNLPALLLSSVTVSPIKDSRIANIVVEDRNPQRGAKIANAFAQAYLNNNLDYKLEGARDANVFLGDQVTSLSERLIRADQRVFEFRKQNQLLDVSLDTRQNISVQNVQSYNQKLADVRARRAQAEGNRRQIQIARDNIAEQESIPEVRQNAVIQQLRVVYVDLSKTRAEMEARYGAKHPNITAIDRKISAIKNDYAVEVDNVLKASEKEYQILLDTEKALVKLIDIERREAMQLAKLEVEYRPLVREAENIQKIHAVLTQRQKETGVSGLVRSNNVRVLDPAVPAKAPAKPRVFLNIALALLTGLVLGVAFALGIDALDNTLKSQDQAEAILGVPVLGMVPIIWHSRARRKPSAEEQRALDLGVFNDPKGSVAEACRSIRTNLLFMSPEAPLRSLVVTSPGPQEGKTTTAISLAITMAQAGGRVLLVDTDLRRPRIHRSFGVANEKGVSNVILGDKTLDETVIASLVPGLDILACGPIPPNPAELLHTARFKEVMKACEARYDRIIYDSPPTSAVTDPAIIGNLADGVLLVIRSAYTTRHAAAFARRQLGDAKARVLGAVVNHVNLSDRAYNYQYSRYYRSYRYGGYYRDEDRAEA